MTYDELSKVHAIPEKPTFGSRDICAVFNLNPTALSRIRGQGWLKSLPGVKKIEVPRCEMFRYVSSLPQEQFHRMLLHAEEMEDRDADV